MIMLRSTMLAACVLAAAVAPASAQQAYPDKPVKIVVAYTAGQGTDVASRYFAEQLTQLLGQTFYVENRGGAGGNIGTDIDARSAPDGRSEENTSELQSLMRHTYAVFCLKK